MMRYFRVLAWLLIVFLLLVGLTGGFADLAMAAPSMQLTLCGSGSAGDLTSGGTVSSSSFSSASNAFDDSSASYATGTGLPAWIQYTFGASYKICYYEITNTAPNWSPKTWELQGYNGSSWVTVDTRTNISWSTSGQVKTFSVTSSFTTDQWRLYITDCYVGGLEVAEVIMAESATPPPTDTPTPTPTLTPTSTVTPTATLTPTITPFPPRLLNPDAWVIGNGGFEDGGSFDYWSCSGCSVGYPAPSGYYAVYRSGADVLYQSGKLLTYDCEVYALRWVGREESIGSHSVSVEFEPCGVESIGSWSPSDDWQEFGWQVESCYGAETVALSFSGSGDDTLDDIQMYCLDDGIVEGNPQALGFVNVAGVSPDAATGQLMGIWQTILIIGLSIIGLFLIALIIWRIGA